MDAARLPPPPPPPLRRRPARGALAVSRVARRVARQGSGLPVPASAPTPTPIDVADVIRGLSFRPAALGGLLAVAAATALHLGAGGASLAIRPKKTAAAPTSVAVEAAPEVLAEDVPVAVAPPPPPSPTTSTRSLPAIAAAATSSSIAPAPAGLAPTSFSAGFPGSVGVGFAAGGGQALPSSAPQAGATSTPAVTPARAMSRPPPRYPPAARRDGVTGVVTLAIQVDEAGAILAVRVVESDPVGVFDDAAIESVRAWRFTPATRDGAPMTTWVRQTIRFTLEAS